MDFILSSALLFVSLSDDMAQPLAERMRPKTLDEYIGQRHLVGEGAVLRKMIDAGRVSSFLLWGPPGVGKDHLGADHCAQVGYTFLYVKCGDQRREGCARCD